jgi:PAS domain S-box-containing protein
MAQTLRSEVARAPSEPPFAVLVIDGNEEHQILSVAALTRRGGLVRTAASGRQALQLAMSQRFDVLVIGSKLRDSTGIEVLRLLAERFPAIPKIFVVPPDGEEAALQALKSGATSYIVKTPRYTELLPAIVEEMIAEAKDRKRLAESEQTQARAVTEKNSAEERLSQSENRLRMILQQAPVLLWSTDGDLHVTSALGGGFRNLDTSRSRERGLTLFDYFSVRDEDVEPIASHRRALGGERVATQIEWQGRTYDVHIEPLRSSEGAIIGTIGVAFDVSERTRTEETLRRSEERFQLLGRATSDVVWDWDLQTDGLWVNENFSKVFGYPAEEIEPTGAWWTDHLHPEDRERVVTGIDAVVRGGGSVWTSEYRFRRRDGTYATVVDRGYALHDAAGHPVRVIGSATDVTKRRKSEAIQSAIYRISEAANNAKDLPELYGQIHKVVGGLMPATNFYIALVDEKQETLEFPYFVDELEGTPPPQKLGRGLTEYVLRTGRALLASPEVFDRLIRDGDVVLVGPPSVDWVGAPLTSEGKKIGVIVVQSYTEGVRFAEEDKDVLNFVAEQVANAIERKRTQGRLLDRERLATMGQLASFIAHELNTPLTNISLLSSAARKRAKSPATIEKLGKIDTERRRATEIIRELLSLSKTREMTRVPTDLREVLRSAVEGVRQRMKPGVALEVDLGQQEVQAVVDPQRIQDVLAGILRYAIGSTAGHTIRVRIEERPQGVAIVVSDPAGEMSEEARTALFEPFLSPKGNGNETGLGLVLAKHIVAGHGGTIDVTPEPGRGSAITVLLPRTESQ